MWLRWPFHFSRPIWSVFAAISFVALSLSGSQAQEDRSAKIGSVMLAFSKAIKGIDKGLAEEQAEAIMSHAHSLKAAAEEAAPKLEPQMNREVSYLFYEYIETTSQLSAAIIELAAEGDLAGVYQGVEDIRRTCISCHVRFGNDAYGSYPSRDNIVTGEIEILMLNGEKRSNRSNVLAFLDRVPGDAAFSLPRENPVFSQKNRSFAPRVLPVMKGTTVDFPNDDAIFHNVFSLSRIRTFDLDIYRPGESKSITFPQTGWVKVYCNIHPNMIAHIIVLDNPFFALTDQQGVFVISGVPDGKYIFRVWHEFGQGIQRDIEVVDASLYRYSFVIQEDRKFVQHRNKFGKLYKQKYGR